MKAGFVGLGKLGLPCALAAAGVHDVVGYDPDLRIAEILRTGKYPHREAGVEDRLRSTPRFRQVASVAEVVEHSDVVFVAVQTPHRPEFEGTTRLPAERADFDYSYLVKALRHVSNAVDRQQKPVALAVISTVLPGTYQRELRQWVHSSVSYAYNPFFIAMGTCVRDYLNPEFVLIGAEDPNARDAVSEFYRELYGSYHSPPQRRMSVASAELCKVYYNVLLGLKIAAANTCAQLAQATGADAFDVMDALKGATERLVSPRYLSPGMGDGGGCHPRDCIALSWLAQRLDLSPDLFGTLMELREEHVEWIADFVGGYADRTGLPIVLLGRAFKAGTNISTGSPAVLLRNVLDEERSNVSQWDPETGDEPFTFVPAVYVIATAHEQFFSLQVPHGSVVIDPWGRYSEKEGVEVVHLGRPK